MLRRGGQPKEVTLHLDGCAASGGPYQQLEPVPQPKLSPEFCLLSLRVQLIHEHSVTFAGFKLDMR